MVTISVPTDDVRSYLDAAGALPDDVRVLVWDGTGQPPDGADDIEFFVGLYNAPPPPREALAGLPRHNRRPAA